MPRCIICKQSVDSWTPHPHIEHRSEFTKLMRVVGSDLTVYQCPVCGCNDRDRHLWLFFEAAGLLKAIPGKRVLHLAPEAHLEQLIAQLGPSNYVRGDLHPSRTGIERIDVENLQFAQASFDFAICNHVLEHVADPLRALQELHRCLAPGGTLVAQTPYSTLLRRTMEIVEPPTADFARLFFGQDDHVRLFGADIGEYFRLAGFSGDGPIASDQVLRKLDAAEYGFNAREPFFQFAR